MGLGAKLNLAFVVVILVMAVTQAGFLLFVEYQNSHSQAKKIVEPVSARLSRELDRISQHNLSLATQLESDSNFKQAFASKDRGRLQEVIKAFNNRVGFGGYETIIQDNGTVFFSSDAPGKFGYQADDRNRASVYHVFQRNVFRGPALLGLSGNVLLTGMVPIIVNDRAVAVLAVGQPINTEFLTGIQKKFQLTDDNLRGFDFAVYSLASRRVVAVTPGLNNDSGASAFLTRLNANGAAALKQGVFEENGRAWLASSISIQAGNAPPIIVVLSTAKIPDFLPKTIIILSQVGVGAGVALILSVLFATGISGRYNTSLRFVRQRAKDLAAQKQDLPEIEGLSGEWLEIIELLETAVAAPRASIANLKQQLARQQEEFSQRLLSTESNEDHLDSMNRQLAAHSRQTAELSKQINNSNQQSILLQQRLNSVLQVSTEGFMLLDQFGSIISANPVILNWLGVSEKEIAGRLCFDLIKKPGEPKDNFGGSSFSRPPGNPDDLIALFYPEGVLYHRTQDKQVEVLAHLQPVVTDESTIAGYVMVLRDKAVHSELGRLRNEIVDVLSRNIRSPLSTTEAKWNALLANQIQGLNPALAQTLVEMHATYQQLLAVVDSYLMMYGGFVPVEQVQRDQVSVTRLVGDCLEQVSKTARTQQVMLDYKTVTGLPTTHVNKEMVRDVIVRLLDKMITVTAPGGRVRAETSVRGNEIRLIISSSGPALQQDEIEDLFVGFIDGKHSIESYQGRLNMYLARNNAERIGGKLWAESEAGRGTAIFLTLPVH